MSREQNGGMRLGCCRVTSGARILSRRARPPTRRHHPTRVNESRSVRHYFRVISIGGFSHSLLAFQSRFSAGVGRGADRVRRAVGRGGHRRHSTSPAIRSCFLDCGAAGLSRRVSRIRRTWPRRQVAKLVRHRTVAADAAGRHRRHLRRAPSGVRATTMAPIPASANIIVSYSTNILVTVLTALVCFRFLRQLNFTVKQAACGVLALLLATTHLHYTQNLMENNYIFLLTLAGFSYQYEWLRTGSRRALLIGSAAFGLNLLTRLTTGLDCWPEDFSCCWCLWFEGVRGRGAVGTLQDVYRDSRSRLCACSALIDRALPVLPLRLILQHLRQRRGTRSAPAKSIPAAYLSFRDAVSRRLLRCVVCAGEIHLPLRSVADPDDRTRRRRLEAVQPGGQGLRHSGMSAAAGLHQLLCPLHGVERRFRLGRSLCLDYGRAGGAAGGSAAAALSRERWRFGLDRWDLLAGESARRSRSHPWPSGCRSRSTRWRRLAIRRSSSLCASRTSSAFALGKMELGPDNYAMHWDPGITSTSPPGTSCHFCCRRVGVAPAWVVRVTLAVWSAAVAALAAVLWRLYRVLTQPKYAHAP